MAVVVVLVAADEDVHLLGHAMGHEAALQDDEHLAVNRRNARDALRHRREQPMRGAIRHQRLAWPPRAIEHRAGEVLQCRVQRLLLRVAVLVSLREQRHHATRLHRGVLPAVEARVRQHPVVRDEQPLGGTRPVSPRVVVGDQREGLARDARGDPVVRQQRRRVEQRAGALELRRVVRARRAHELAQQLVVFVRGECGAEVAACEPSRKMTIPTRIPISVSGIGCQIGCGRAMPFGPSS